jgi:hypothetical protein
MKYICLLLFICAFSANAQAQCPNPCNVLVPPPPNTPYFTIDTVTTYTFLGSCGLAPNLCEATMESCDQECVNFGIRWHGCCTLDSIELHFEGCVKVCAEVWIPTHPSWNNDNGTSCVNGIHKLRPYFTTDRLSTCDVLVVRVCGDRQEACRRKASASQERTATEIQCRSMDSYRNKPST